MGNTDFSIQEFAKNFFEVFTDAERIQTVKNGLVRIYFTHCFYLSLSATADYLERYGIDPVMVMIDFVDGYLYFKVDSPLQDDMIDR